MAYTSTQMDDVRTLVNYLQNNGASAPADIANFTGIPQVDAEAYLTVLADAAHADNPGGIAYINSDPNTGDWEVVDSSLLCIEQIQTDPLMEKIRLALLTRDNAFNCSIPATQLTADAAVLQGWTDFIADCVAAATGDASQGDELRDAMANLDICCGEYLAQATN